MLMPLAGPPRSLCWKDTIYGSGHRPVRTLLCKNTLFENICIYVMVGAVASRAPVDAPWPCAANAGSKEKLCSSCVDFPNLLICARRVWEPDKKLHVRPEIRRSLCAQPALFCNIRGQYPCCCWLIQATVRVTSCRCIRTLS